MDIPYAFIPAQLMHWEQPSQNQCTYCRSPNKTVFWRFSWSILDEYRVRIVVLSGHFKYEKTILLFTCDLNNNKISLILASISLPPHELVCFSRWFKKTNMTITTKWKHCFPDINGIRLCALANSTLPAQCAINLMSYTGSDKYVLARTV